MRRALRAGAAEHRHFDDHVCACALRRAGDPGVRLHVVAGGPGDVVGVGVGALGAAGGEEEDRFEEVRLALRVLAEQKDRAGREIEFLFRVVAEVGEREVAEVHWGEDRCWRREAGGGMREAGGGRREAGGGRREAGSGRREAGSGKREAGSGRREAGGGRREAGSGRRGAGSGRREAGGGRREPRIARISRTGCGGVGHGYR